MTSPHAPTPEAITPLADQLSPHLTAVAEHVAEHRSTGIDLEEPHLDQVKIQELERERELEPESPQQKEQAGEQVKDERQEVERNREKVGLKGEGKRRPEDSGELLGIQAELEGHVELKMEGNEEIKREQAREGDPSPSPTLPLLESIESSNHETSDTHITNTDSISEGPSNQLLLAEGRAAAGYVPAMGGMSAVQDDAAVATMPPRVDHIPESMGLFSAPMDAAAFMNYMRSSPAEFYGMGMNAMNVNHPLSLPQSSADGLLALQMASTMNIDGPFPFGQPSLDPSPAIGGQDNIVEDHHRVVSVS